MTIARREQIDTSVARWYHCMTRCVRQAFLLAEGMFDRKAWIEDRLEELAQVFAVGVGGFSVMDNHLHVLLRLDPLGSKRQHVGAWRVQVRREVWRSRSGSARSRIDASWTRPVKACLMDSRSGAISC
ncbi:MAG: hypothetical protein ACHRXM_03280 [Isosphaerales bacterium]